MDVVSEDRQDVLQTKEVDSKSLVQPGNQVKLGDEVSGSGAGAGNGMKTLAADQEESFVVAEIH